MARRDVQDLPRASAVQSPEGAWPSGLTDDEAARRRARGAGNTTTLRGSVPTARIVRRNVVTILNLVLFSVSILLLALGLYGDALVTAGPVATNVLVAVVLEIDAKRKLDRLTLIGRPEVTLRRDGRDLTAAPDEIVLGDTVVLRRGDQAVVDARLVAGRIETDDSVLTGESRPVAKEPPDEVLSGSVCLSGTAAVEVTRVGHDTFASRLAEEARRGSDDRTPLRRDLDTLIVGIGLVTVAAAVPVGLALRRTGEGLLSTDALQAAAVLVALVPQGLAVMATLTYALAAVRIGRLGAIVQRIDAVESMSRVDTLCLDKTGTLTSQALVMEAFEPVGPDGTEARALLAVAAASARSRDRTIEAIATALPGQPRPLVAEVPFSSDRRWSAVTVATPEPRTLVIGAAEVLAPPGPDDGKLGGTVRELAARGCRVLLFAVADDGRLAGGAATRPPAHTVLAVMGFREEVRADAGETLRQLRSSGVELKLVSGDDPTTVSAIARVAGVDAGRPVSGRDVAAMSDDEVRGAAGSATVFGRIGPHDKQRIVVALRELGRYVAMVGDGVNDVLALRRAHLGIAMESGSPAARAVAGLILVRDRFAILPHAIVEGQRVVSSMIAVGSLLLARTVYVLLIVVAAALLELPFPFTPRNNAVLALVTVGIPTLVLALWVPPVRAPRSVVRRILGYAVPSGLAVAVLAVPVMVGAFGGDVATARSTVTTATVFAGIALIPVMFPPVPDRPGPVGLGGDPRPTILAVAMLVLYAVLAAVPPSRGFFELEMLPAETVGALLAYTLVWMAALIVIQRSGAVQLVTRGLARRRPGAASR